MTTEQQWFAVQFSVDLFAWSSVSTRPLYRASLTVLTLYEDCVGLMSVNFSLSVLSGGKAMACRKEQDQLRRFLGLHTCRIPHLSL